MPFHRKGCRIVVVDDFPAWRDTLRQVLSRPGWRLVGEARDGPGAIAKASQIQPDIVILDIGMPGINGIEVAKQIRRNCPQTRIIFLTQQTDEDIMEAAIAAGASAYVLKSKAFTDLSRAIAAALQDAAATLPS
jgi:DNA-binding NarL/FixJ family response regulator